MKYSVQSLRQSGNKVRITHLREYNSLNGIVNLSKFEAKDRTDVFPEPHSCGGITTAEITTPSGEQLVGIAKCSAEQGFYKKLGVYMAVGRAVGDHPTEREFLQELKAEKIAREVVCTLHFSELSDTLDYMSEERYKELEEVILETVKINL